MRSFMPITPLAISTAAANWMRKVPRVSIQTHYRHGCDVHLKGCEETLFVSPPGYGIFPMHLILRRHDFDALTMLPVGTPLYFGNIVEKGAAGMDGACIVITPNVRTITTFLPENKVSKFSSSGLAHALHAIHQLLDPAAPTGLDAPLNETLDPQWRWRAAFACSEDQKSRSSHVQSVRALLGRGQGATPAGDDMLLGALALQRALLPSPSPLMRTLAALNDGLPERTTATSVAYLRWAQHGHFGSHLLSLIRDIRDGQSAERIVRRARRVARHGASSGHDTLLGIVLAGRALLESVPPAAAGGI